MSYALLHEWFGCGVVVPAVVQGLLVLSRRQKFHVTKTGETRPSTIWTPQDPQEKITSRASSPSSSRHETTFGGKLASRLGLWSHLEPTARSVPSPRPILFFFILVSFSHPKNGLPLHPFPSATMGFLCRLAARSRSDVGRMNEWTMDAMVMARGRGCERP